VVAATPLLEVVEEILALPGSRLFRYLTPEGEVRDVTAPEVNRYLRELVGERYTSKDIRTWGGTVRAATILADIGPAPSERQARKNIALACKLVATELGNTPAICRSAYIHPTVLEHYLVGETIDLDSRCESAALPRASGYYPEEVALLRVLQQAEAERRRT
jgi:DNA topoisomerase-1